MFAHKSFSEFIGRNLDIFGKKSIFDRKWPTTGAGAARTTNFGAGHKLLNALYVKLPKKTREYSDGVAYCIVLRTIYPGYFTDKFVNSLKHGNKLSEAYKLANWRKIQTKFAKIEGKEDIERKFNFNIADLAKGANDHDHLYFIKWLVQMVEEDELKGTESEEAKDEDLVNRAV